MVEPQAAPQPAGAPKLLLPPNPAAISNTPSWRFHRLGVERKRAETIIRLGHHALKIEATAFTEPSSARETWQRIQGVGEWTSAEAARLALGDADAVSVGDFHLCHTVGFALAGEVRSTDERMLELLEPYQPQRGRVAEALTRAGIIAPRFGPRYRPLPIASW
jgi:3-methyladenine DNA glycosylase/8-oxoguanine DNA glycosylase